MRFAAALACVLLGCSTPAAPPAAPAQAANENSPCEEAAPDAPICRLSVADVNEGTARAALSGEPLAIVRDGDRLTVFAEADGEAARVCCSLQGDMERIGETNLWVARYRLARLDEAAIRLIPPTWLADGRRFSMDDAISWRGPEAPPHPQFNETVEGQRFERTLWSEHLQETRRIIIYLPPGHDPSRSYPALFMADGGSAAVLAPMWERMFEDGVIPPIVVVGAASGQSGIVEDRSSLGIQDFRAADYLPGFEEGANRFENHLRFFSEELVAYAVREFGVTTDPTRRAVSGFSNGGTFALAAGLRRPDVFGVAIPLSPAWRLSPDDFAARPARARFLMSAGLYESGRWSTASAHAATLREHGYDVDFQTPAMGHDRIQEELMLARYLPVAFGQPD